MINGYYNHILSDIPDPFSSFSFSFFRSFFVYIYLFFLSFPFLLSFFHFLNFSLFIFSFFRFLFLLFLLFSYFSIPYMPHYLKSNKLPFISSKVLRPKKYLPASYRPIYISPDLCLGPDGA